MKNVRLKCFLIISIIILSSIFIACNKTIPTEVPASKTEGKIKLRAVLSSEDTNKIEAFKNFSIDIKNLLPEYDVSFDFIKGDVKTYETKIKVLLSSNNAPDVFLSNDIDFSRELFSSASVQPIDTCLDELKFWNMVVPSAKVQGYHGHIYTVPFDTISYGVLEVNTDLFKQNNVIPPTNFSELQTAVGIFKSKGIIPIALGGKDGKSIYNILEGFAYTIDSQVVSKLINGKISFSDEPFKLAASKVKELIGLGAFPSNMETITNDQASTLFYSGKAAMHFTESQDFKITNSKLNGKCQVLYYPTLKISKEGEFNNPIAGGVKKNSGLFISQISKHPVDATKLAIEMSKYYNRYMYEKQNNNIIIYIPNKLGWKSSQPPLPISQQFMENLAVNKNTSPRLLQEDIPTDTEKSIIEASSAFSTNLLSIDTYIKKMDDSLKIK